MFVVLLMLFTDINFVLFIVMYSNCNVLLLRTIPGMITGSMKDLAQSIPMLFHLGKGGALICPPLNWHSNVAMVLHRRTTKARELERISQTAAVFCKTNMSKLPVPIALETCLNVICSAISKM